MHPKDADGMANSVDPDQTASSEAVCSWSALFAETYLSQYIEFVRYMCIFSYIPDCFTFQIIFYYQVCNIYPTKNKSKPVKNHCTKNQIML